MTLPLHDDEPTPVDSLGREPMVRRLAAQVAVCHPPQVFGVHGDWGAGKTSFLRQLREALGDWPNVTAVTFEAWRYQHEKVPIVALLHEVRGQLSWTKRVVRSLGKQAEVTVRGALLSLEDLTKKIGIQASKIQAAGEKWEQDNLAVSLPSDHVRQHLEKVVRDLLGPDAGKDADAGKRLVVLIDDLDRCQPVSAFALLEGIKIYLTLSNCVFVLGMDQKVVEAAIADQLPAHEKANVAIARRRSREYLEKICQNLVHLPLMRDPAEYLYSLLHDFKGAEKIRDLVVEHKCLPANARKVKAYANLLRQHDGYLSKATSKPDDETRAARLFVILTCLYQFHPEIYRLVEAHGHEFYNKVRRWAQGHREEAAVHPRLAELEDAWTIRLDGDEGSTQEPNLGESAFADPVEGNVFRIQRLVRSTGNVSKTEIQNFLLNIEAHEEA